MFRAIQVTVAVLVAAAFAVAVSLDGSSTSKPVNDAAAEMGAHEEEESGGRDIENEDDAASSDDAKADRVVLVSFDGLPAYMVELMPELKKMMGEGTSTLQALAPCAKSGTYCATTAPSHAAMLTGVSPETSGMDHEPEKDEASGEDDRVHGVKFRWNPLKTLTIATVVKNAGGKVVGAVQKGKLVILLAPDGNEANVISTNDEHEVLRRGCDAAAQQDVKFVFLHFKSIDHVGHAHKVDGARAGWNSEAQKQIVRDMDEMLGMLRTCLKKADDATHQHTALIVTSDHGGTKGSGHGHNDDESRRVPIVMVGPGIKAGSTIVPNTPLQDITPTILQLLGIEADGLKTLDGALVPFEGHAFRGVLK